MKKKILSMLLAASMVFTSISPAYGAEFSSGVEGAPVLEVQEPVAENGPDIFSDGGEVVQEPELPADPVEIFESGEEDIPAQEALGDGGEVPAEGEVPEEGELSEEEEPAGENELSAGGISGDVQEWDGSEKQIDISRDVGEVTLSFTPGESGCYRIRSYDLDGTVSAPWLGVYNSDETVVVERELADYENLYEEVTLNAGSTYYLTFSDNRRTSSYVAYVEGPIEYDMWITEYRSNPVYLGADATDPGEIRLPGLKLHITCPDGRTEIVNADEAKGPVEIDGKTLSYSIDGVQELESGKYYPVRISLGGRGSVICEVYVAPLTNMRELYVGNQGDMDKNGYGNGWYQFTTGSITKYILSNSDSAIQRIHVFENGKMREVATAASGQEITLDPNSTYYVKTENYGTITGNDGQETQGYYETTYVTCEVSVSVPAWNGTDLQVECTEATPEVTYRYVPSQSGWYRIYSTEGENDPFLEIRNSSWGLVAKDDDGAYEGNDFNLKWRLDQGETYYFVFRNSSRGDDSFTAHIREVKEIARLELLNGPAEKSYPQGTSIAYIAKGVSAKVTYIDNTEEILSDLGENRLTKCGEWLRLAPFDVSTGSVMIGGSDTPGTYKLWIDHVGGSASTVGTDEFQIVSKAEMAQEWNGEDLLIESTPEKPEVLYRYTCTADDWYRIYSTDASNDPYLTVYNSDGEEVDCNDQDGGNNNFSLKLQMTEGETYYFGFKDYYGNGNFTVHMEETTVISAIELTGVPAKTEYLQGTYISEIIKGVSAKVIYTDSTEFIRPDLAESMEIPGDGWLSAELYDAVQEKSYSANYAPPGNYVLRVKASNGIYTDSDWEIKIVSMADLAEPWTEEQQEITLTEEEPYKIYSYIPAADGEYQIYSSGADSERQPYIDIYGEDGSYVNGIYADGDFSLTAFLSGGKSYYFKFGYKNNQRGTYTAHVRPVYEVTNIEVTQQPRSNVVYLGADASYANRIRLLGLEVELTYSNEETEVLAADESKGAVRTKYGKDLRYGIDGVYGELETGSYELTISIDDASINVPIEVKEAAELPELTTGVPLTVQKNGYGNGWFRFTTGEGREFRITNSDEAAITVFDDQMDNGHGWSGERISLEPNTTYYVNSENGIWGNGEFIYYDTTDVTFEIEEIPYITELEIISEPDHGEFLQGVSIYDIIRNVSVEVTYSTRESETLEDLWDSSHTSKDDYIDSRLYDASTDTEYAAEEAPAGTYVLKVKANSGAEALGTKEIKICSMAQLANDWPEDGSPVRVDLGENPYVIYRYTPKADGLYRIYSSDSATNPCIAIYDSDGGYLGSDDYSGDGMNFSLTQKMAQGTTYYLKFSDGWAESQPYTVNLEAVSEAVSIELAGEPRSSVIYVAADAWNISDIRVPGLMVKITYADGSAETLSTDNLDGKEAQTKDGRHLEYSIDNEYDLRPGNYDLKISLDDASMTYPITVKPLSELPELTAEELCMVKRNGVGYGWCKLSTADAREKYRLINSDNARIHIFEYGDYLGQIAGLESGSTIMLEAGKEYYVRSDNNVYVEDPDTGAGETIYNTNPEITFEAEEIAYITEINILNDVQGGEFPYGSAESSVLSGVSAQVTYSDGHVSALDDIANDPNTDRGDYVYARAYNQESGEEYSISDAPAGTYVLRFEADGARAYGIKEFTILSRAESAVPWTGESQRIEFTDDDSKKLYCYTPERTGDYLIYSSDNGEADPRLWVYDSGFNEIGYNDDGDEDLNFFLKISLEAGQPYYLEFSKYSEGEAYTAYVVPAAVPSSMEIVQPPYQTAYVAPFERYSLDGLKVKLTYENGQTETIAYDEKTLNGDFIDYSDNTSEAGTTVTLSYGGRSVQQEFTVTSIENIAVVDIKEGSWVRNLPGDSLWYKFIPEVTDEYKIESDSDVLEVYAYREDIDGYQYLSHFERLEAGKTYYLRADMAEDFRIVRKTVIKKAELLRLPEIQTVIEEAAAGMGDWNLIKFALEGSVVRFTFADESSEFVELDELDYWYDDEQGTYWFEDQRLKDGRRIGVSVFRTEENCIVKLCVDGSEDCEASRTIPLTAVADMKQIVFTAGQPADIYANSEVTGLVYAFTAPESRSYYFSVDGGIAYMIGGQKSYFTDEFTEHLEKGQTYYFAVHVWEGYDKTTLCVESAHKITGLEITGMENLQVVYGLEATRMNDVDFGDAQVKITYADGIAPGYVALNDVIQYYTTDEYGNKIEFDCDSYRLTSGENRCRVYCGDVETPFSFSVVSADSISALPLLAGGTVTVPAGEKGYYVVIATSTVESFQLSQWTGSASAIVLYDVSADHKISAASSTWQDEGFKYEFSGLAVGKTYYLMMDNRYFLKDLSITRVSNAEEEYRKRLSLTAEGTEVYYQSGQPLFELELRRENIDGLDATASIETWEKGSLENFSADLWGYPVKARTANGSVPIAYDENGWWMPGTYQIEFYAEAIPDKTATCIVTVKDTTETPELETGKKIAQGLYTYTAPAAGDYVFQWSMPVYGRLYREDMSALKSVDGDSFSQKLKAGQKICLYVEPYSQKDYDLLGGFSCQVSRKNYVDSITVLTQPDTNVYYTDSWIVETALSLKGARIQVNYADGYSEIVPFGYENPQSTTVGTRIKVTEPEILEGVTGTYYFIVECGGQTVRIPVEGKSYDGRLTPIQEGTAVTPVLASGETAYYTFTPQESGIYALMIENADDNVIWESEIVYEYHQLTLEKGKTYHIGVTGRENPDLSFKISRTKKIRSVAITECSDRVRIDDFKYNAEIPIKIHVVYQDGEERNYALADFRGFQDSYGNWFNGRFDEMEEDRYEVYIFTDNGDYVKSNGWDVTVISRDELIKEAVPLQTGKTNVTAPGKSWKAVTYQVPGDGYYSFDLGQMPEVRAFWLTGQMFYTDREQSRTTYLTKGNLAEIYLPGGESSDTQYEVTVTRVGAEITGTELTKGNVPTEFLFGTTEEEVLEALLKDAEASVTYKDGKTTVVKPGEPDSNGCTLETSFYADRGAGNSPGVNVTPGMHTVYYVLSMGIYEREVIGAVQITIKAPPIPGSISGATVTVQDDGLVYDGTEKKPAVTVKIEGKTLVEKTDYTLTYESNINAGIGKVKIQGTGEYSGIQTKSFTIAAAPITGAEIMLEADSAVYTGTAIEPGVTEVTLGERSLIAGTDYTVSYEDNVDAGTAKVIVTGKGNYDGTVTKEFTITPAALTGVAITLEADSVEYTGEELQPEVTEVTLNNVALTAEKDYTVFYEDNENAGTAKAIVTGAGNYGGTATKEFTITPATLTGAVITLETDAMVYTGEELEPAVTAVTLGKKTLTSADYDVIYENNVDRGTDAKVIITGKGNYTGQAEKTFTISNALLTGAEITLEEIPAVYTGTAIEPGVTSVALNGDMLIAETDYTVSYEDNVNAGTAKVIITGRGNYGGTVTKEFTISPAGLAEAAITLEADSVEYTGEELQPEVTEVTLNNVALTAEKDYTVFYEDNENAGTAKAIVTGAGNYTGAATKEFTITPAALTGAVITLKAETVEYTGGKLEPEVTAVTLGGKTLTSADYEVTYSDNEKVGTSAKVIITGKGNYSGMEEKAFTISKAVLKDAGVVLEKDLMIYTGQPLVQKVTVTHAGKTLAENTDYTVEFKANTEAGTASVVVTAVPNGSYTGSVTKTFVIKEANVEDSIVTLGSTSMVYTGGAHEPSVKVVWDGKVLKEGTDYTLVYKNNVNAGKATVTVKGAGIYSGETTKTFTITPADLSKAQISGVSNQYYTGKELKPNPAVKLNGKTLKANTDYTVSYKNNTRAGTATVQVTGKGNYKGTKTATFKISYRLVSSVSLNTTSRTIGRKEKYTLKANAAPSNAYNRGVTWKSSNTKVATVSASGVVTGKEVGTAVITATAKDGSGKKATCTIKVYNKITYGLNKGTQNKKNTVYFYKQKKAIKLYAPTRKGYTFAGWYSDKKLKKKITSISKSQKKDITVYAKWTKVSKCKAPGSVTLKNSKSKTMSVSYKKPSGAAGYEIQYSRKSNFKGAVSVASRKTSATIKKMAKGKTYYVRVRAYKLDSTGAKVYGSWSSRKSIKIKK